MGEPKFYVSSQCMAEQNFSWGVAYIQAGTDGIGQMMNFCRYEGGTVAYGNYKIDNTFVTSEGCEKGKKRLIGDLIFSADAKSYVICKNGSRFLSDGKKIILVKKETSETTDDKAQ